MQKKEPAQTNAPALNSQGDYNMAQNSFENIPQELQALDQWVLWKEVLEKGKKKPKKVPFSLNGEADATDPTTWNSFDSVVSHFHKGGYDGIGFVFTESDPYTGIDFDTYKIEDKTIAQAYIESLDSYTELSPSVEGHHVIIEAKKPDGMKCKTNDFHNGAIEIYDSKRFFTFTGNIDGDVRPIEARQEALETLFSELMPKPVKQKNTQQQQSVSFALQDAEVLSVIKHSKNSHKGEPLFSGYPEDCDESAIDMGICNLLAFFCGKDAVQMDRIFRRSALYRKKWDSKRGATTYGQMTIQKAISDTKDVYQPRAMNDFHDIQNTPALSEQKPFSLSMFSLNGESEKMKSQMLEDKFILGRMAILGQSTVIFAKPNAGKTLLTIWLIIEAIKSGEINASDIFYINSDDNHKGIATKLELAEKYGFHMLASGYKEFKNDMLVQILNKLVMDDTARGKVLVLDTVKKFTDIMRKDKSSEFGESIRQFIAKGGSVIMLAHVNKRRDDEGKVIFGGTSDLVDDADCAYTLDIISEDSASLDRTVMFENFKNRGDVALKASYTYDYSEGRSYLDRLNSIKALDEEAIKKAKREQLIQDQLLRNKEEIDVILEVIRDGIVKKTELIKEAYERSAISKKKLREALVTHTGNKWLEGHRWKCETKEKNAKVYSELLVFSYQQAS